MKRIFVISLNFLLLTLVFKDAITYVHFFVNRDYISKELCVNKNRPEKCCEGICYLKSKLKKSDEQKSEMPALSNEREFHFFSSNHAIKYTPYLQIIDLENSGLQMGYQRYSYLFSSEIFHPPC